MAGGGPDGVIPVGDWKIEMKKLVIFSIVVILATLLLASPVLAIPGKGAVKGEVTGVDSGTVTIETKKGGTVVVTVPEDYDLGGIEVGDWVLIKGSAGEGSVIEAEWFKPIGKGRGNGEGDEDKPEGKKENSAFCAEGKKEKDHPLATKVAENYKVTEEFVMGYFCDGYGMGAIMLALKTSGLVDGSTPDEVLKSRSDGQGWGQIWKEKELIGSEKEGHSPPGLLKRSDLAGPKDKDE